MFEVGRMCMKIAGREAGKICCVVKKIDSSFVMVTGPHELTQVKRRKCNIAHLEPLQEMIKISADASDAEVAKAYQEQNIFSKLQIHVRSKEELSALAAKKEEKQKAKKLHEEKLQKEKEEWERKKKELEKKKESQKKEEKPKKAKSPKKEPVGAAKEKKEPA